jgi:hypothetical protein
MADIVWTRIPITISPAQPKVQTSIWLVSGGSLLSSLALPDVADSMWRITGISDQNGDGISDFIWRKGSDSGTSQIWHLQAW